MLRFSFLREHWPLIAFGFFMCFCSSFGQTFFISWFGGEIRAAFSLSHGEFGSIYSTATLASAAALVWLGRLIDVVTLRSFSVAVLLGLACACVLVASTWNVVVLGLAIFGLRLFGQGLVSHAAMTAIGRSFNSERGRVVSIASLGYNFGEAVLPRVVVAALVVIDWRTLWIAAAVCLVASVPAVVAFLNGHDRKTAASGLSATASSKSYRVRDVLRDPGLWLRLPAILAPAFIYTGLIFHQVHMAEAKGWSPSLMAWSFGFAAVASVVATILAGPLVDWLSARRLVPFYLTPLIAACLVLHTVDAGFAAPVFFVLLGLNAGISLVLLGTVWPELYGITHLGAIRALGHAAMVFASGLAPAIMGLLIDAAVALETIALWSAFFGIAASLLGACALPFRGVAAQRA
jgi:sugar phosphate permease